MPIDVELERADTPGCRGVAHLNNAGASLQSNAVMDAVIGHLRLEQEVGGYEAVDANEAALDAVYTAAVRLLGGTADGWAFVESATRAWNAAFSSLQLRPGDRVLTTRAEYPSNMGGLLRARERDGVEIVVVPDDEHGQVDVDALVDLLDDRIRLVSVTHVPTQGGLVNPAEAIGDILRDSDVLYQVDACQSVGQLPVTIDTLGCDVLSFTGRKFVRGPRATGMVWASDVALAQMGNPAGVDMSGSVWDAPMSMTPLPTSRRFEPYEVFFAGKAGLAVALDHVSALGIESIEERNSMLSARLRTGLSAIEGVRLRDLGIERSAIVTFEVASTPAHAVRDTLRARGVNVSVSSVTSARLDFPARGVDALVRASVHYYNTTDEVDLLINLVDELIGRQ